VQQEKTRKEENGEEEEEKQVDLRVVEGKSIVDQPLTGYIWSKSTRRKKGREEKRNATMARNYIICWVILRTEKRCN